MSGRDYTDSEPDIDPDELVQDIDDADTGAATPATASAASPTKEPKSKDSNQSLKITVRVPADHVRCTSRSSRTVRSLNSAPEPSLTYNSSGQVAWLPPPLPLMKARPPRSPSS